jgi:cytochrome c-type biogenesis protein CcmH/NrfF
MEIFNSEELEELQSLVAIELYKMVDKYEHFNNMSPKSERINLILWEVNKQLRILNNIKNKLNNL